MTVATLLTLLQILSALGSVSGAIINIRNDLEKRNPSDPAPAEHIAAVKAALGSGGSVWDESHAGE
jgi:hypothetical protein